MEDSLHGTIASKFAIPEDRHILNIYGQKLVGRVLKNPAQTNDEMPTMYDCATQVGALKELPNAISDVIIVGDAVFVTIAEPGSGQYPGIFHSQAILDGNGKIAAWTPWQRIGGIQEGVKTAVINSAQHFLAYLKAQEPEIVSYINLNLPKNEELIKYSKTKGDLSDLFEEIFSQEKGGIQGLYDFACATPGFNKENSLSMLIATGYKKIVLVETGRIDNFGFFNGYKEQFANDLIVCERGKIQELPNSNQELPRALVVQGGILEELGAISYATIITDGNQSWFLIAGYRGMAVLAHNDGSGWSNTPGLQPGFAELTDMEFRKFGSHNRIKKVISDGCNLYIVTNSTIERITINQNSISSNTVKGKVLASSLQVEGTFFDMGVSGPLAVLATSKGLLVNGVATDVRINSAEDLQWRSINLPNAKGPVYNLFFISSTEHKNGFGHGGQLYASVGSLLENTADVYRLFIHDVYKEGVTNKSVEVLPDHVFVNKPFPLFCFNSFRDHFATDGAHYFSARSRHISEKPFLRFVSLPSIKVFTPRDSSAYKVALHSGKGTKNITAIVQNSATGNWLIAGDFGLRIHN